MTREERKERGRRAARLLNDELVQEAIQDTEKRLFDEWRNASSVECRERAHSKLLGLEELQRSLRIIMDDGIAAGN